MWAEKDSYVLKQATASESVKSSSLDFEFMLTSLQVHITFNILEEIDEDGSGTVDFDEFVEMMTG